MYHIFVVKDGDEETIKEISQFLQEVHKQGRIADWSQRICEPTKEPLQLYLKGIQTGADLAFMQEKKIGGLDKR